MIYAILFEDNESRADMRSKLMSDHLTFLERHAANVQAAGPLKDTASDAAAGGLWIISAESPSAVRSLIETDPFWPTGLRKSARILEWTQVFLDGKRRI